VGVRALTPDEMFCPFCVSLGNRPTEVNIALQAYVADRVSKMKSVTPPAMPKIAKANKVAPDPRKPEKKKNPKKGHKVKRNASRVKQVMVGGLSCAQLIAEKRSREETAEARAPRKRVKK